MMDTEALILALSAKTGAVPQHAAERRLAAGISAGALISLLVVVAVGAVRPDLAQVVQGPIFWSKAAYTFSLGICGLILTLQLSRPEKQELRWLWLSALPVAAAAVFSGLEVARTAGPARAGLFLDPVWVCLPLVALLALPIFGGLVWSFQCLAPTRLRAAGAAAGLTAGGFAATLYCLYCQQVSPTYILTRYTIAIAMVSIAGAVLGPRLLRW